MLGSLNAILAADELPPVVQANFASSALDYTSLSTLTSMPSGGSISRAGQAMLYDSTGKLTYAQNNLLLNTATLSTQSVTTAAINYILSFSGTGSVTLSGTYSGTLNGTGVSNRVYLAFTATAGTLTATVSGSVTSAQLEAVTYQTTPSTYVATTSAAYYGPRFDYNPSTLAAKGLLIEGSRTNTQPYSGDPTNATYWTTTNITRTGGFTAPDGTATAVKYAVTSTGATNGYVNTTATASTMAYSVYLKQGSAATDANVLRIYNNSTATILSDATINYSTGVITPTSGVIPTAQNAGNGWWRVSWVLSSGISSTHNVFVVIGYTGVSYTGGVYNYVWGAQAEASALATSYIPNPSTGSTTRAAETFAITGYSTNLIEAYYTDEATGNAYSAAYNAGTAPSTSYGWTTSLRPYTNAYAGSIATPSWIDNSGTTGNRMQYDSTGLLTWAPANMLTYSQDFSNAAWTKTNVSISGTLYTAPDGTTTANKLIPSNATQLHKTDQSSSISGGITCGVSVYAKQAEFRYLQVSIDGNDGNGAYANFDLQAGTVTQSALLGTGTLISATIQSAGNSYYRIAVVGNRASGANVARLYIGPIPAGTTGWATFTTPNGTDGVYIWGGQVEPVTYQTSPRAYIPTTSSAVYNPRYDYNPSVTPATPNGMLIEESRSNLQIYSQDFTNAAWVKVNTTVSSGLVSPDGITISQLAVPTTTSGNHEVYGGTKASTTNMAFSVYVKPAGYTKIALREDYISGQYAAFDCSGNSGAGSVLSQTAGVGGTITSVGNGWYKISMASTITTTGQGLGIYILDAGYTSGAVTSYNYAGNGTSGFYLFGAQVEAGSFPTSYIPTTSSSVTRVADVVKLASTASTVANANAGSAIAQTTKWEYSGDSARYLLASSTSRGLLFSNSSSTQISSTNGTTVLSATIPASGTFTGNAVRSGISWSASGRSIVANGGTVATDSTNLSTGTTTYLGGATSTPSFDGWVASLALYNVTLPTTVLQAKSNTGVPY
jgi:hypothetical protein